MHKEDKEAVEIGDLMLLHLFVIGDN